MALSVQGVSKRFAGIKALDDIDLDVGDGECVGLIGPNGAGKTTLFNCILGMLRPEAGVVRWNGRDITRLPVHERSRLGIGRTFQRMELFASMTPRRHLLVTAQARSTHGGIIRDLLGRGRVTDEDRSRADQILDLLGMVDQADVPVESLTLGQGRLVELARALMCLPKIILLDEPSSGLDRAETAAFARVLDVVRAEWGASLLIVEHDLELVTRVSDRLYVIDFGTMIASGTPSEVMANPAVREAYLGASS
jgi:branched-chain amino acid transport system ATP-binding protein